LANRGLPVGEPLVEHDGDCLAVRRPGDLLDPVITNGRDRVGPEVGAVAVPPEVVEVGGGDRRAVRPAGVGSDPVGDGLGSWLVSTAATMKVGSSRIEKSG